MPEGGFKTTGLMMPICHGDKAPETLGLVASWGMRNSAAEETQHVESWTALHACHAGSLPNFDAQTIIQTF